MIGSRITTASEQMAEAIETIARFGVLLATPVGTIVSCLTDASRA